MAIDLVSIVMQQFGPDTIGRLANIAGLDKAASTRALGALVPGLLTNFASSASTAAGAQVLLKAAAAVSPADLAKLETKAAAEALISKGSGLAHDLIGGPATNGLILGVSKYAGLSFPQSQSLVGLAAPLAAHALGGVQKSQGLDAAGMAKLFGEQAGALKTKVPKGFSYLPSAAASTVVAPQAAAVAAPAAATAAKTATAAAAATVTVATKAAAPVAAAAATARPGWRQGQWTWLWLLLGLGAGAWALSQWQAKQQEAERERLALVEKQRLADAAAAAAAAKARAEAEAKMKADAEAAAARQRAEAEAAAKKKAEADAAAAAEKARLEAEAKQKAASATTTLTVPAAPPPPAPAATAVPPVAAAPVAPAAPAAPSAAQASPAAQAVQACQTSVVEAAKSGAIRFQVSSANLTPDSVATLDRVAAAIKACANTKILVEGHTSADGNADTNKTLSTNRAKAVADYLVRASVEPERILYVGYGQTKPIAPNDTDQNKALNRRIEFVVSAK